MWVTFHFIPSLLKALETDQFWLLFLSSKSPSLFQIKWEDSFKAYHKRTPTKDEGGQDVPPQYR